MFKHYPSPSKSLKTHILSHTTISKAFSLIKISIAMLVIGILIAGVSSGLDLYQDFRLA